jgi:hypothetical protein
VEKGKFGQIQRNGWCVAHVLHVFTSLINLFAQITDGARV